MSFRSFLIGLPARLAHFALGGYYLLLQLKNGSYSRDYFDYGQKINTEWLQLQRHLESLKTANRGDFAHVAISLEDAANTAVSNFSRVMESALQRQLLIEKQIRKRKFRGPLHDKYHQATEQVSIDLNNLFSSLKTAINRLGAVVYEALPNDKKKRVSQRKVFGSLKQLSFKNKKLEEVRKKYVSPNPIIGGIVSFRNEQIEHHVIDGDVRPTLLSAQDGTVKKVNYRGPMSGERERDKHPPSTPKKHDDLVIVETERGKIYYVHVQPIPTLGRGKTIRKGELFGHRSVGDPEHLRKYGHHGHVFWDPTVSFELQDSFDTGTEVHSESPSQFEAVIGLLNYLNEVTCALVTYLHEEEVIITLPEGH